ncbi:MAG TPA: hypothetical protein VGX96_04085 [Candidatus Elarobacter sp.]|jgi:hypothetical protein|nr:hypothetical protein [Candidatus Elarobacter sp.]
MRVFAGALLAVLAAGPDLSGAGNLAVTLDARPLAGSCAVVSTATIVAYDARVPHDIAYRFIRSDGSVSRTGKLSVAGDGAVAQSVRDTWKPRGTAPWVALEITAPERIRSPKRTVSARCARSDIAVSH